MRILVTSDLHYALRQYDWLLSVAAGYDAVILAGDLLDLGSVVELRAQIVVVRTYLEQIRQQTRVIVCSGNHDLDILDAAGERSAGWMARFDDIGVISDGESVALGDLLITAFKWWDGPEGKAAIARQLAEARDIPHRRWIWVYHAPPADSPVSWNGRRHFGDRELSAWIADCAPDIVLSGHVHPSPFVGGGSWADRIGDTWAFNPGQQPGTVPAHIVLDLDRGEALWSSFEGMQRLALDAPDHRPSPVTSAPDAPLTA